MDRRTTRVLVCAVVYAAVCAGNVQAEQSTDGAWHGPQGGCAWEPTGQPPQGCPRVLDFSTLPVSIDQPGLYVVDHDWSLGTRAGNPGTVMNIDADNVVVDFRGFTVSYTSEGVGANITGNNVTLRNGVFQGDLDSYTVYSTGNGTTIDRMNIYSYEGPDFKGANAVIRDSTIQGRFGTDISGPQALVENSSLSCEFYCLSLYSNHNQVRNDQISPRNDGDVTLHGSYNLFVDNVLDERHTDDYISTSIEVSGNGNQILNNTVLPGVEGVLINVDGTANTLTNNVAAPADPAIGSTPGDGIRFTQDGNYYGSNRLAAKVPFALGGTQQTDWGGNVGY